MLVKISLKFPQVTETSLTQAHFPSSTLIVTGPSPSGHHLYLLWWCLSHMDLKTASKKHYPPQLRQSIIKTSVSPLLFIWDHSKTNMKCIHKPLFFQNRILFYTFFHLYCIYCICNHLNYSTYGQVCLHNRPVYLMADCFVVFSMVCQLLKALH